MTAKTAQGQRTQAGAMAALLGDDGRRWDIWARVDWARVPGLVGVQPSWVEVTEYVFADGSRIVDAGDWWYAKGANE